MTICPKNGIFAKKMDNMEHQTDKEYAEVRLFCKNLFEKKNKDYGTAWRILRLPSLTDQIYIKAMRIRTIQERGLQKIGDSIENEFVGMINYCLMAIIQIRQKNDTRLHIPLEELMLWYEREFEQTQKLQQDKNHDYGEAWRMMRVSSMTDIILMKLLRIKEIEDHEGQTIISEGVESGYRDIVNYSVFCLILSNFVKNV
jgi:hypothetical protein